VSLLTFRRLERHGRLGNQMWQLASTIGIAERIGATPIFPRWSYAAYFSLPEDLWVDEVPAEAVDAEATTHVEHIASRHRGYLQDRALWAHIEDRIVGYFQPSPLALQVMALTHPRFFAVPAEKRIAIHIRRGDAVGIPHLYPLQSPLYVKGALEQFEPGHVTLFGDDPGWMMDNLGELGAVMGGNADWADMFYMASCGQIATANSSFSYWAAATSKARKVCYPLAWYGRKFHDLDFRLMIPPTWVGIRDAMAGAQ
jgi:hypothetical protein